MNKFLCITILVLLSQPFYAQQSKFDSIYNIASLESIRMVWAINIADSLYKTSNTAEQKARASMLSAGLLRKTGMTNEALSHAKRADSIAEKSRLYDLEARVCGLISTIYRDARLPVQGKVYLEKALRASQKISDPEKSLKFQGNLHQEMAYYEMDNKNYEEAINILQRGEAFFEKLPTYKERKFHLATNKELLAKNYVFLNQYDKALSSYEDGLEFLKQSGAESALEGFIYNGMGNVFLTKNKYEKAIEYYIRALDIAETSQFLALKDEVYQALTNYYKITKDQENYVKFNEKYIGLRDSVEQSNMKSVNQVVKELRSREKSAIFNLYTISVISLVLIIVAFCFYFYVRWKRKKDITYFKQIINELKQRPDKKIKNEVPEISQGSMLKEMLPVETEYKIVEKLGNFENSTKYLEKGFTLAMLAVELETNTKYLSHIIKKHKKTDFNTYINKLKINYIINKIHDEPIYANYKISYLADECGFSSHSKFTTTFKNITGVSPTVFLSLLAEERNQSG